nr:YuiB family protein [Paenibacillus daejeonensis]
MDEVRRGLHAVLQVIIAMLLFFVMMFGIGFILNMLMKTTWFPIYLFILVLLPLGIYYTWSSNLSWQDNITAYTYVDVLPAVAALIGAIVSGWAIKLLRKSGYKMYY